MTQTLKGVVKSSVWLVTHGKYISDTEGSLVWQKINNNKSKCLQKNSISRAAIQKFFGWIILINIFFMNMKYFLHGETKIY
jgi:hypothetical protein